MLKLSFAPKINGIYYTHGAQQFARFAYKNARNCKKKIVWFFIVVARERQANSKKKCIKNRERAESELKGNKASIDKDSQPAMQ